MHDVEGIVVLNAQPLILSVKERIMCISVNFIMVCIICGELIGMFSTDCNLSLPADVSSLE